MTWLYFENRNDPCEYDDKYRARLINGRNGPRLEIRHKTCSGDYLFMKIEYNKKYGKYTTYLNGCGGPVGFWITDLIELKEVAHEGIYYIKEFLSNKGKNNNV